MNIFKPNATTSAVNAKDEMLSSTIMELYLNLKTRLKQFTSGPVDHQALNQENT